MLDHVAQLPADVVMLQEVSTRWRVVGSYLLLALLLALLFGISKNAFDNTIADRESAAGAWFAKWTDRLRRWRELDLWQWWGGKFWAVILIPIAVLIYGGLYTFLDPEHGFPSRELAFLLISLGLSLGLVELADDVGTWLWARRLDAPTHFRLMPFNLVGATLAAVGTRLLRLVPVFIVGAPGVVEVEDEKLTARDKLNITLAGWLAVLLLAVGAWFLAAAVADAFSEGDRLLGIKAPDMQDFLLILYLAGIEVVFFQLLPWANSGGEALFRNSRLAWLIVFAGLAFIAWMTLFNPNGSLIEVFKRANVMAVLITIAVIDLLLLLLWRFGPPAQPAAAPQPAGGGGQ